MSKISKATIKKLVNENSGVTLNDKAAEALVEILERKAKDIADYAVKNAKKKNRKTIMAEDIDEYVVKHGS